LRDKTGDSFQDVSLDRIDLEEDGFAFAYPKNPDERLVSSVGAMGILTPLILQGREGAPCRIVAGNRRARAAREAGLESVPARILSEEVSDADLFLLNIRENAETRIVNDIERGLALHRLETVFRAGKKSLFEALDLLGLSPGRRVLTQYVSLARLTGELKRYVISHSLPLRVSSRLARLPAEDQKALGRILRVLVFGANLLREILDLTDEIFLREGIPLRELLSRESFRTLLENPDLTSTQKRDRIRNILRSMRFPGLTEETERLGELLKRVGSPGVPLRLPPFLEGDALQVSFSFKSIQELKGRLRELGEMAEREEVVEVLKRLRQG